MWIVSFFRAFLSSLFILTILANIHYCIIYIYTYHGLTHLIILLIIFFSLVLYYNHIWVNSSNYLKKSLIWLLDILTDLYEFVIYPRIYPIHSKLHDLAFVTSAKQKILDDTISYPESYHIAAAAPGIPTLDCPICMFRFRQGVEIIRLKCTHFYHTNCLLKWMKRHSNCPICRRRLAFCIQNIDI